MMNNYDLTSSSSSTQLETSRGTKRAHPSPASQAGGPPDYPAPSDISSEGRSPRRMRISPTDSYGGNLGLNLLVTGIPNTAAPCAQDGYEFPAPPRSLPRLRTLPLSSQRRCAPLLVHQPGKRTVYVQDMVFRLLVISQLEDMKL